MAVIDDAEDYAPEMIEQYLLGWNQLVSAAEGGSGHIPGYTSGGKDRLGIACLVADLERAADKLPIEWASTREVFRLQLRRREYNERIEGDNNRIDQTHRDLFEACQWMARALGWKP